MKRVNIEINQETINYLQRLHFEVVTQEDIIQRIIESHRDNPAILDSGIYKRYAEKLSESKAAYDIAKQEVTKNFVPDEYKNEKYSWNVDFATGIMTIEANHA